MIKKFSLYKRGGRIYIDSTTNAGRVRFSTGLKWSLQNCAAVEKDAHSLIYRFISGEAESVEQAVADFGLTLNALGNELMRECADLKQATKDNITKWLKLFADYFGKRDFRAISNNFVLGFFADKSYYTKGTAKGACSVLNRVIALANAKGAKLEKVSVRKLRLSGKERENLPLSLNEIKQMLDLCEDKAFKNLLTIAFFTGMRSGELLALQWGDVDLDNEKILISRSINAKGLIDSPKTKSSMREIDILPIVARALESQKSINAGSRFIFGENGKPLSIENVRKAWFALLAKANLTRRVFYNTRHSFASIMLQQGEEPMWVMAMLGHKNLNITLEFYAKFLPNKKIARARFLENF